VPKLPVPVLYKRKFLGILAFVLFHESACSASNVFSQNIKVQIRDLDLKTGYKKSIKFIRNKDQSL
jgi:hypothetical protein